MKGDAPITTPRIDEVLTQFRQRVASDAVPNPVEQLDKQSSQPARSAAADSAEPVNEERIRKLEHQVSQLIQQVLI